VTPELFVVRPGPGQAVVELTGEHDLATSDETRLLFESLVEENELVVIDLSEVTFIDSSFLKVLVQADAQARERGSRLRVQLGAADIVQRVLEITGLLDHLDCVSGREEALQAA
jgi:anti-sigma B factor antagonist